MLTPDEYAAADTQHRCGCRADQAGSDNNHTINVAHASSTSVYLAPQVVKWSQAFRVFARATSALYLKCLCFEFCLKLRTQRPQTDRFKILSRSDRRRAIAQTVGKRRTRELPH